MNILCIHNSLFHKLSFGSVINLKSVNNHVFRHSGSKHDIGCADFRVTTPTKMTVGNFNRCRYPPLSTTPGNRARRNRTALSGVQENVELAIAVKVRHRQRQHTKSGRQRQPPPETWVDRECHVRATGGGLKATCIAPVGLVEWADAPPTD